MTGNNHHCDIPSSGSSHCQHTVTATHTVPHSTLVSSGQSVDDSCYCLRCNQTKPAQGGKKAASGRFICAGCIRVWAGSSEQIICGVCHLEKPKNGSTWCKGQWECEVCFLTFECYKCNERKPKTEKVTCGKFRYCATCAPPDRLPIRERLVRPGSAPGAPKFFTCDECGELQPRKGCRCIDGIWYCATCYEKLPQASEIVPAPKKRKPPTIMCRGCERNRPRRGSRRGYCVTCPESRAYAYPEHQDRHQSDEVQIHQDQRRPEQRDAPNRNDAHHSTTPSMSLSTEQSQAPLQEQYRPWNKESTTQQRLAPTEERHDCPNNRGFSHSEPSPYSPSRDSLSENQQQFYLSSTSDSGSSVQIPVSSTTEPPFGQVQSNAWNNHRTMDLVLETFQQSAGHISATPHFGYSASTASSTSRSSSTHRQNNKWSNYGTRDGIPGTLQQRDGRTLAMPDFGYSPSTASSTTGSPPADVQTNEWSNQPNMGGFPGIVQQHDGSISGTPDLQYSSTRVPSKDQPNPEIEEALLENIFFPELRQVIQPHSNGGSSWRPFTFL